MNKHLNNWLDKVEGVKVGTTNMNIEKEKEFRAKMGNNRYKVEITKTYCIDVLAKTEQEAIELAEPILDRDMLNGSEHYIQTGDTEFNVFDVTDTDDPFCVDGDICPYCKGENRFNCISCKGSGYNN